MSLTQRDIMRIIRRLSEMGQGLREAGVKNSNNSILIRAGPIYATGSELGEIAEILEQLIPEAPLSIGETIDDLREQDDG